LRLFWGTGDILVRRKGGRLPTNMGVWDAAREGVEGREVPEGHPRLIIQTLYWLYHFLLSLVCGRKVVAAAGDNCIPLWDMCAKENRV
jgi:hypothetical protein